MNGATFTSPQYQYVTGQGKPEFPSLLATYQLESDAMARSASARLDLRYGEGERETFDFFPSAGATRGTLVYFHAGYWQSRDKSNFRFLAKAYTVQGVNVALVNYSLCPSVRVPDIVDCARRALPVIDAAASENSTAMPFFLAGHSAGGHIAVELAMTDWSSQDFQAFQPRIAKVIAISGVYDLAPLVDTTLNEKLRMNRTQAREASPLLRVQGRLPPAVFVVGGAETSEFIRQSSAMQEAWIAGGNTATLSILPGEDHFSILRRVAQQADELLATNSR